MRSTLYGSVVLGVLGACLLSWSAPVLCGPVASAGPAEAAGPVTAAPEAAALSLRQALTLAEEVSPGLKAAEARESGSKQAARVAQAGYFPSLGVDAVDSTGFPGSAAGDMPGFYGLAVSPFREGVSADAYGQWNLVDPTVWYAVKAAGFEVGASRQYTRIQRSQVDVQALTVYLQAVLYRGDQQAWATLVDSLKGVRDTVDKFVRNGQYSEVQRLLIKDQLEDANIRQKDYAQQYRMVLERLGILTGLSAADFSCPGPDDLDEKSLLSLLGSDGGSPVVERAEQEAKAAAETTKRYASENLPKIELGGSAGYLQDTRLGVQPQDYSAFAGVTLPLFEGFRIDASEKAASREQEAREQDRSAAQLALDDFNARMDEEIRQAREDLKLLLPVRDRAARAVTLSRYRYLNFLGPLSDLQQALKDRVTADTQVAEVKTQLLLALGSKAFVNGGTITRQP